MSAEDRREIAEHDWSDLVAVDEAFDRLAAVIAGAPAEMHDAAVAECREVVAKLLRWRLPTDDNSIALIEAEAMQSILRRARGIVQARMLAETAPRGTA